MHIGKAHAAVLRARVGEHACRTCDVPREDAEIDLGVLAAQQPCGLTIVGARKRTSCERIVFPVHMFFRLRGRGRFGRQFKVVD